MLRSIADLERAGTSFEMWRLATAFTGATVRLGD
jgi:hypothetical protein